ncbi:hypothetical protein T440DRAFT_326201 [Plenodomus tracheiphilus IPT5]|uniref:Uncharacterized protein n=1 Tax=Plenodomus tracheiphilus IPT5 TaxID=1408161 RepID=A0A6A7ANX7_9PLEO|nr:hypothetical protein T440DRAFT_326201 [Plenodomus tracheiphilus IPT5]
MLSSTGPVASYTTCGGNSVSGLQTARAFRIVQQCLLSVHGSPAASLSCIKVAFQSFCAASSTPGDSDSLGRCRDWTGTAQRESGEV